MHKIDFSYNATYIVRQRDILPEDGVCAIKGRQQIITVLDPATVPKAKLFAAYQTVAPENIEAVAQAEFLCVRNTDNEIHLLHPLTIKSYQLLNYGPESF